MPGVSGECLTLGGRVFMLCRTKRSFREGESKQDKYVFMYHVTEVNVARSPSHEEIALTKVGTEEK